MTARAIAIRESTDVAEARRSASRVAQDLGFPAADVDRIALVVTEAARNILKHTQTGGRVILSPVRGLQKIALDVLTLDKGDGIADVSAALRDGHSTAGGPGTGLGAISRAADTVELVSVPGGGTALLTRFWPGGLAPNAVPRIDVGAIVLPYPGETVCGDAYTCRREGDCLVIVVADGLGHGADAGAAASAAMAAFRDTAGASPVEIIGVLHKALHSTRGAAVAVARIDPGARTVRFAGVGNIGGVIVSPAGRHNLVSHSGIVGEAVRKIQEFTYAWPEPPCLLVLHSDGVSARWDLDPYPGVLSRDPALVAGLLFRDHARGKDDTAVVVAQERRDARAG